MSNIQKASWICIEEGRLLVVRSKGKDLFYLPGGKIEEGETIEEAVIREIKEEVNADIIPSTIKFARKFSGPAHGKPVGTMLDIYCYFADYTGEISASSEIEELKWITIDEKYLIPEEWWMIIDWLSELNLMK